MMGFEPLINQRLLPPTFPRYTTIRSRAETVDYLGGLTQRLGQFAGVVPLSDNLHALIVRILAVVVTFFCILFPNITFLPSAHPKPQFCSPRIGKGKVHTFDIEPLSEGNSL